MYFKEDYSTITEFKIYQFTDIPEKHEMPEDKDQIVTINGFKYDKKFLINGKPEIIENKYGLSA